MLLIVCEEQLMAIIPVIVYEKHPSSVILSVQDGLLTVEVSIVIILPSNSILSRILSFTIVHSI